MVLLELHVYYIYQYRVGLANVHAQKEVVLQHDVFVHHIMHMHTMMHYTHCI